MVDNSQDAATGTPFSLDVASLHRLRVAPGNHPGRVSTAHAQPVSRLAAHTVFSASSKLQGLRVTFFRIAALLDFASSVISYRYTLRFCLESIQARPRRRLIHRAHNPTRLYIHRLGYPLIPASHLHGQGYSTHLTPISPSLPQLTPCISCVHLLLFVRLSLELSSLRTTSRYQ